MLLKVRSRMPSLIWINQFAVLPEDGGGTRHFELGRELVKYGWRVTILASDLHLHSRRYKRRAMADDRETKIEIRDGVEMRWVWACQYERNDWQRALNWLTFNRSVVRERKTMRSSPDLIIGSSPQIFAATAARTLARRLRVPFVLEVRDLWPESLVAAGGKRGLAYRYLDYLARTLYDDADRILVLARGVCEYLARRGIRQEKLLYIPNGVDVGAVRPASGSAGSHSADDPPIIIYAGAHGPANGLDRLLDAAEIIGPQADVRFLLVGDGPVKKVLQQEAKKRGLAQVEFHDPVAKPELVRLLHKATAGLMILREASLFSFGVSPNKLFDYLAVGLPVISNVPGDVANMLSRSGAGVQAADGSAGSLAAAILELLALSEVERRRRGMVGRRWVEAEHSREVLGARLDRYLRALIDHQNHAVGQS